MDRELFVMETETRIAVWCIIQPDLALNRYQVEGDTDPRTRVPHPFGL